MGAVVAGALHVGYPESRPVRALEKHSPVSLTFVRNRPHVCGNK